MLDGLTSLSNVDEVHALATLSPTDESRLQELRTQERDLRDADPKRLAADLTLKAQRIEGVATHIAKLASKCGDAALEDLKEAVSTLGKARDALEVLRKTALTADLLPGTGEVVWRQLWDAARVFSSIAYPAAPFPVLSPKARCPLCQQELGKDAKARLTHFKEYVESDAQTKVRDAEKVLADKLYSITSLVIERDGVTNAITELSTDDAALAEQAKDFLREVTIFQTEVKTTAEKGAAPPRRGLPEGPAKGIGGFAKALKDRAVLLAQQASGMKPEDRAELTELEGRAALRSGVAAVVAEIERKKRLAAYSECLDDTTTTAVTRKSTELTKRLVTDQLQRGFQAELAKLKFGHLAVEIRPAGGARGALFHHLVFSNAPNVGVSSVVSEGESRTLSLAAFLTELGTAPTRSAIIFDDPVSSLDHVWRERIADRLVDEAKTRQVIVFTHDLLFLRLLMDRTEHEGVSCEHQYVRQEADASGVVSPDLPWVALGTTKRLGVLRNRWQAAEKLSRTATAAEYEKEAAGLVDVADEVGPVSQVLGTA